MTSKRNDGSTNPQVTLAYLLTSALSSMDAAFDAWLQAHPDDKDRLQQSFVDHPDCWNKDGHADSLDRWAADPCYTLRPARVGRGRHAVAEQTPSDDSFTCGGAGRLAAPPGRD